ncbi:MAG: glycosyl hydrolase, partial [Bacteroidia bacterium]|nr:glycosyl hydrolase [Bacteroidia bacterium]
GGSYLGTIEVLNTEANAGTKIMPAPIQYLGREARDMRYRYNWNAPIIWSQHEPNTYYHGAQMLLRTRDLGSTWEEVSPDLSNADDTKLGNGGGPYTNEAVGAENYGTISYIKESQHEAGVIYVATDDGVLQLTKDNCETWERVTPKGLRECLINAIDISPHDPGTVYIATTRYKFNDHTPGLYKSTNYGKTWTNISSGIPYGAYTRAVREDDVRKDLLFAATELGVYVSWNGGGQWEQLQLNLPVTPINDLKIHKGDVIVATSGRSFWILDDLGLVRQYDPSIAATKLFEPEPVIISNGSSELDGNSSSFKGSHPLRGVNPASGAVLYYQLPELAEDAEVTLEVKNDKGNMIRKFSSTKITSKTWDGGPSNDPSISKKKGLNRFVWNLRHVSMPGIEDVYIEAGFRGHKVSPGNYIVTLRHGNKESSAPLQVLPNPLYPTTPEEYATYDQFMTEVESNLTEMHDLTNSMAGVHKEIDELVNDLPDRTKFAGVKTQAKALLEKLKTWDEDMVQRKSKAYDDVENFPNKFTANYIFMINQTASAIPRVNQPSRDRRAELETQWATLKTRADEFLNTDIPALNQALWDVGIGAVSAGVMED